MVSWENQSSRQVDSIIIEGITSEIKLLHELLRQLADTFPPPRDIQSASLDVFAQVSLEGRRKGLMLNVLECARDIGAHLEKIKTVTLRRSDNLKLSDSTQGEIGKISGMAAENITDRIPSMIGIDVTDTECPAVLNEVMNGTQEMIGYCQSLLEGFKKGRGRYLGSLDLFCLNKKYLCCPSDFGVLDVACIIPRERIAA